MTGHDSLDHDPIGRLRAVRPSVPDELTSTTGAFASALRQEIMAMPNGIDVPDVALEIERRGHVGDSARRSAKPTTHSRSRVLVGGAVAAALAIGAVVAWPDPPSGSRGGEAAAGRFSDGVAADGTADVVGLGEIRLIAERSGVALGSGRASVRFAVDVEGSDMLSAAGTARLAFSGDDIEMVTSFDGTGQVPGFVTEHRTVGGEFYLLDGPPDGRRWVRDTNANGERAVELFSLDPRTLFGVFSSGALLEVVGSEEVDGVPTRHLRSTAPFPAPDLHLGNGPVAGSTVERLDLWVDADDVTRRIDLMLSTPRQVVDRDRAPSMERSSDGTVTLRYPDGRVEVSGPESAFDAGDLPTTTRTARSTYSVTFSDIGAAIVVEAPAEATDVAEVG